MTQLTDRDLAERFDESLNDTQGEIRIGNLTYLASDVLKRVDPVAYRCGFADWLDAELSDEAIYEHSDGTYHDEPESEVGDNEE